MFWVFVAEVPTGAVADYLGRKHSLFAGSILFGIGMIVYGITPSFVNFLLAEFILAIGCALISGADEALLYDSLKQEGQENLAKKIFGRAHTASLLGMMISAPIGGVIAAKWGLNFPTLLTSIPVFMAGIVAWSFVEPSIKHTVSETKKYTIIIKDGFKYFFGHPALRKLAFNSLLVATASYYVIWWYQPLLMRSGIDISVYGWFHLLLLASEILISSQFERLEKWFGSERKYLQVSALLVTLAFLFAALVPGIISVVILLSVGGGFGLTRIQYMGAIINRHVESDKRATVLSAISMFRKLALVPLNPILGLLANKSLPWALITVSLLPLLIFAVPAGVVLLQKKKLYR